MSCQPANPISRRAFMPLVAAAVLSPALITAARAEGIAWEIYRPEGLGFEVEMPGKPKITIEDHEQDYPAVKSVDAEADVKQMTFGANYVEYRIPITLQEAVDAQQLLARALPAQMRVTAFTMNGIDGRDISMNSDGLNAIQRVVVTDSNRQILITVLGDRGIHTNATVRRFLDSFKLLPLNR